MAIGPITGQVLQGALWPPYALVVNVAVPPGANILGTQAVSAYFARQAAAGGAPTTWTASLSGLTATSVTLTHPYVSADTATLGDYTCVPVITMNDGSVWYGSPVTVSVVSKYQR